MKMKITMIMLFLFSLSAGCVEAEQSLCESGSKETVMEVVLHGSSQKIRSCMNELNRTGLNENVLRELDTFLITPDGQDLDDVSRMAIRDTILQGYQNGKIEIDPSSYYADAESVLANGVDAARAEAVSVIARRDDERSVSLLSGLLEPASSESLFKSTVVSLAMMCVESASVLLERAESDTRLRESRRTFANETREQAANFKRQTGWCK